MSALWWWLVAQSPIVVTAIAAAVALLLCGAIVVRLGSTTETDRDGAGWEDHPGELLELGHDGDREEMVTVRVTRPGFGIAAVRPSPEFSALLEGMLARYNASAETPVPRARPAAVEVGEVYARVDAFAAMSTGHPAGHGCRDCDLARGIAWNVEHDADVVLARVDDPPAADTVVLDLPVGYRGRHWPDTASGGPR